MQNKHDVASPLAGKRYSFFNSLINQNEKESPWQMIYSGWWHTLFFNQTTDTIQGYGRNDSLISDYKSKSDNPWSIPLRDKCKVKQVAAGDNHILILYENGLLDGYGRGSLGQLGIGSFTNRELATVNITLPNGEVAASIAASGESSFVVSEKGTLYGFGNNSNGELGLGKESTFEFPTPISLPHGAIPERIITAHQRTIIVCQQGELYGFGENTSGQLGESSQSNWSQKTPLRLANFEKLKPRAIAIGKHAVMVLSAEGDCFFYGIDMHRSLPINYLKGRMISLPPNVKAQQISFSDEHLLILSEEGELWEAGRSSSALLSNKKEQSTFVKINLGPNEKIISAVTGHQSTFIFNAEGHCYALGRLTEKEVYVTPKRLYLSNWGEKINKITSAALCSPTILFSKSESTVSYQDNTEVIQVLENDEEQFIEILRPLTFNTSLSISMFYAFYSNTKEVDPTLFHKKKIGTYTELVTKHQGTHPTVVLDLGKLDLSSYISFQNSLKQLFADLYVTHRFALFDGGLKEIDKEKYQEIATQSSRFFPRDALNILINYLHKNYGKKVKLFIDHADICIRQGLFNEDYDYMASELKKYINPAIADPLVSQTVLMGVHPSFFEGDDLPKKHTHSVTTFNSKYLAYFHNAPEKFHLEKNHFIYGLKITSEECEQIAGLLKENTLEITRVPEQSINKNKVNLIQCLIQLGLVNAIKGTNADILTCSITNSTAKNILQTLHNKWQIQNMNRITIIFDIDNVLAAHEACTLQTILFFLRHGAILNAYGITHYIPPGILELMKFLFSQPMVKVAFFSSGDKKRNDAFVKELLIKALGKERYEEIASEIIILSSNHMSANISYKDEEQKNKYGLSYSNDGKKDISKAIAPEDFLVNAVFIDNNPEFIYYDQVEHYLHSETLKSKHFENLGTTEAQCSNPVDELFPKVNAAFYLAGVLWNCIQSKNKDSVSNQLFSLQFTPIQKENQDTPTFIPNWDQPKKSFAIYEKGLEVLQQYNPELTLITAKNYKESVVIPATKKQQTIVLEAKEHEYEDKCLVM